MRIIETNLTFRAFRSFIQWNLHVNLIKKLFRCADISRQWFYQSHVAATLTKPTDFCIIKCYTKSKKKNWLSLSRSWVILEKSFLLKKNSESQFLGQIVLLHSKHNRTEIDFLKHLANRRFQWWPPSYNGLQTLFVEKHKESYDWREIILRLNGLLSRRIFCGRTANLNHGF